MKETPYTMSTDSNDVPVSVVDMDVPVTAIDEVLEDYERNIVENDAKSLTRTESAGSKGTKNNVPKLRLVLLMFLLTFCVHLFRLIGINTKRLKN